MRGESLIGRALAGVGGVRGIRSGAALKTAYKTGRGMSGVGMTAERKLEAQAASHMAYRKLRNRGAIRVGMGGAVIGMGVAAKTSASGYKQYQGPPSMQGLPTQSNANYY